jgi:hypothetical protein
MLIINGVFEDTLTNVIRANRYTPGLLLYLMTYTRTRSLRIINCNALAIVTVSWKERGSKIIPLITPSNSAGGLGKIKMDLKPNFRIRSCIGNHSNSTLGLWSK